MSRPVSLYRLERETGVHRDTLARLAESLGIVVERRHNVRQVGADDAGDLADFARLWRDRPRLWAQDPALRQRRYGQ